MELVSKKVWASVDALISQGFIPGTDTATRPMTSLEASFLCFYGVYGAKGWEWCAKYYPGISHGYITWRKHWSEW